ncbi:MAG: hypothetical protein JJU27_18750 [Gammaproteobacteria bacterium]|nr:hypothetical protein [Gammaproteobacteria bacterium]
MSRLRQLPMAAVSCFVLAAAVAPPAFGGPRPGLSLTFMQTDGAAFPTRPATLRSRVQGASVGVEVMARDSWALHAGAVYAYTRHEYEEVAGRNRDLHRLLLPISLQLDRPGGEHRVTLTPVAATSSNVFKDLLNQGRGEDWQWHGAWRWQAPEVAGWRWQTGLARSAELGRLAWVPEVGASLRSGDWYVSLVLPRPELRYQLRADTTLVAGLRPAGGQWRVRSDEQAGRRFDYRVREWETGMAMEWRPLAALAVSAELGMLLQRRHQFIDDAGDAQRRDAGHAGFLRLSVHRPF